MFKKDELWLMKEAMENEVAYMREHSHGDTEHIHNLETILNKINSNLSEVKWNA